MSIVGPRLQWQQLWMVCPLLVFSSIRGCRGTKTEMWAWSRLSSQHDLVCYTMSRPRKLQGGNGGSCVWAGPTLTSIIGFRGLRLQCGQTPDGPAWQGSFTICQADPEDTCFYMWCSSKYLGPGQGVLSVKVNQQHWLERLLHFQMSRDQFLASIWCNLKLSLTPVTGDLVLSYGLLRYLTHLFAPLKKSSLSFSPFSDCDY